MWDAAAPDQATRQSLDAYNAAVRPADIIDPTAGKQQTLASKLDDAAFARLADPAQASLATQAHLNLVSAPDASRWLHAVPAKDSGNGAEPDCLRAYTLV